MFFLMFFLILTLILCTIIILIGLSFLLMPRYRCPKCFSGNTYIIKQHSLGTVMNLEIGCRQCCCVFPVEIDYTCHTN